MTHHRTWFDKCHPDHFGKRGMRMFHVNKNAKYLPKINVGRLWSLIPPAMIEKFSRDGSTEAPVIDLRQFGYSKVLGTGKLFYDKPIVVMAKSFTKGAEEKILKVGGQCILVA
jgi:large subunit ribosomal protein L27Ae